MFSIFDDSANFLAAALAGKCLFDALLFTRLQVEGMLLHFLDDVFLLNFPLETPQGILDGLTVLNANFGHSKHPQSPHKVFRLSGPLQAKSNSPFWYTPRPMARCPLCSERSAKRFCPAKQTSICTVCCGTKREIEIDCPSSCVHLQAGRSYESERKPSDPALIAQARSVRENFLADYGPILAVVGRAVAEERFNFPWLVDPDVADVYRALIATSKTLSSGIYYETLPEGPPKIALFRKLKAILDDLMAPSDGQHRALRVSEILEILDFLMLSFAANTSGRPRSRQYLDWLSTMSGVSAPPSESGRLIIP